MDATGKNRQLRRQPKQGRSKVLFDSICEACIRLIESGKSEQLSVSLIAKTAGVTVSSFYQYFPNVDAVVGSALSKYNEEDLSRLNVEMHFIQLFGSNYSPAAVGFLVDFLCDRHIRLLKKYGSVYQRYHREFYMQRLSLSESRDADYRAGACRDEATPASAADISAFLTRSVIVDLLGRVVESSPHYLESDLFRQMLKNMLVGYINQNYPQ